MNKTIRIRMGRGNYEFLSEFTKEEQSDLCKTVRDLVTCGGYCLLLRNTEVGKPR
jgi:hypothetical protein